MSNAENPPAFPTHNGLNKDNTPHGGMTLRDYFANSAMLADLTYQGLEGREDVNHIAAMAYQMADAMLEVRGES